MFADHRGRHVLSMSGGPLAGQTIWSALRRTGPCLWRRYSALFRGGDFCASYLGLRWKSALSLTLWQRPCYNKRVSGEVSEGFKEPVLKIGDAAMHRGFESHPLRHRFDCAKAERSAIRSAFLYKGLFARGSAVGMSDAGGGAMENEGVPWEVLICIHIRRFRMGRIPPRDWCNWRGRGG